MRLNLGTGLNKTPPKPWFAVEWARKVCWRGPHTSFWCGAGWKVGVSGWTWRPTSISRTRFFNWAIAVGVAGECKGSTTWRTQLGLQLKCGSEHGPCSSCELCELQLRHAARWKKWWGRCPLRRKHFTFHGTHVACLADDNRGCRRAQRLITRRKENCVPTGSSAFPVRIFWWVTHVPTTAHRILLVGQLRNNGPNILLMGLRVWALNRTPFLKVLELNYFI